MVPPIASASERQARAAIETKLANALKDPEVVVGIFVSNSKSYDIAMRGTTVGDTV